MVNKPTSPFRNSSSVIPSPSVYILTSLALLYLHRCCSHEDVVTVARFPRLCSVDSLIDDVSAARFPRLCSVDLVRNSLLSPNLASVSLLGLPRLRFTTE